MHPSNIATASHPQFHLIVDCISEKEKGVVHEKYARLVKYFKRHSANDIDEIEERYECGKAHLEADRMAKEHGTNHEYEPPHQEDDIVVYAAIYLHLVPKIINNNYKNNATIKLVL